MYVMCIYIHIYMYTHVYTHDVIAMVVRPDAQGLAARGRVHVRADARGDVVLLIIITICVISIIISIHHHYCYW